MVIGSNPVGSTITKASNNDSYGARLRRSLKYGLGGGFCDECKIKSPFYDHGSLLSQPVLWSYCSTSTDISRRLADLRSASAHRGLSGATRMTIIYCTLTNPTTFSEKVELTYQQGLSQSQALDHKSPSGRHILGVAARADLRMLRASKW